MPRFILHTLCLLCFFSCCAELSLKDKLKYAKRGDYIVTKQGKTYTVMLIGDKQDRLLTIEEISVPMTRMSKETKWQSWMQEGAPHNTCWVRYTIDTETGKMQEYYSRTLHRFCDLSQANSFLTTLLNLRFTEVPLNERKRKGGNDFWQPQMIVDGKPVSPVVFEPYKTVWPHDGSDLSGKEILVYVPEESDQYPSYFPYWLQVSGMAAKTKIRIVDSGRYTPSL